MFPMTWCVCASQVFRSAPFKVSSHVSMDAPALVQDDPHQAEEVCKLDAILAVAQIMELRPHSVDLSQIQRHEVLKHGLYLTLRKTTVSIFICCYVGFSELRDLRTVKSCRIRCSLLSPPNILVSRITVETHNPKSLHEVCDACFTAVLFDQSTDSLSLGLVITCCWIEFVHETLEIGWVNALSRLQAKSELATDFVHLLVGKSCALPELHHLLLADEAQHAENAWQIYLSVS
mmetsp:Transcript_127587/g.245881  ORF Transcript_127587/g.245881 Transcript_127587/m.245881 type:complete len:233 (+) Transcript_127587:1-699(+)